MARYFLKRIRVEGFRGINNEADPLDLSFRTDATNSVFAVNGTGKSSLFEALSYAIRGHIPKLDALQAQERPTEYYCNRFDSRSHATIDLEFEPDDGSGKVDIDSSREKQFRPTHGFKPHWRGGSRRVPFQAQRGLHATRLSDVFTVHGRFAP